MINVLVGLILAILVFIVLNAVIIFAHSTLVFGLLAVVVFISVVFYGVPGNLRGPR